MSDHHWHASSFGALEVQPPDALLGLIAQFRADTRPDKIDLGIGVFRDDDGMTPVMRAVKAAETRLLATQTSKAYLGAEGDAGYTDQLARIVFGEMLAASDRLTGVQTPGGTGALRIGAELIAQARPGATVWMGTPTWPNHEPIFRKAGLAIRMHAFFDAACGGVDVDAMICALSEARAGDVVLLHGCCHNPTGATLTPAQWTALTHHISAAGLVPLVDLAYQGLGDGLAADAAATNLLLDAVPDALVAYSCDKNFGLYRERVGALWVQGATPAITAIARGNILSLARSLWSMPPDHGAAIVRIILETPDLRADWADELGTIRARLNRLRRALAAGHPALSAIADQRGIFAVLPIGADDVVSLRAQHGIYMAGNGRINVAGLRLETIPGFIASLEPYLS